MIICICKNISDTALREHILEGCKTFEELQVETDVCTQCENCECEVRNLIEETLNDHSYCCDRS